MTKLQQEYKSRSMMQLSQCNQKEDQPTPTELIAGNEAMVGQKSS